MRLPVAFIAGYLFLDWVSYIHPLQQSSITPWNPHPALAIALLAIGGQRWLPVVFVAVALTEVVVRQASAGAVGTAVVAAVLSLGYAAMARALTGPAPTRPPLESRADLVRLVAVVTLGTLATGALYVGALWASGVLRSGDYLEALVQFWIGDSVGVLVTLPLIFTVCDPARRVQLGSMLRQPVTLLQGVSVAVALWLVFGPVFAEPFKFFYVLFLPLVWIAARWGLSGATLAALLIQGGVILAAQATAYPALTVFELQALLIALTVTGLFLGVTVDERQRTGEELRHSLRLAAAGEMSAALAHELNQPLAALCTYARAARILSEAPVPDRFMLTDTLEKVLVEANRSADVVLRLRDFFRTGATNLELASLPSIAHLVVESFRVRATGLGVTLQEQVEEVVPEVLIDRLQIEVVLRNLVANGIEAAATGNSPRSVAVEIDKNDQGFVRVIVRDSGLGVAPALGEAVFEPFWSSKASGMGMGLTISRAIVEAHGGRLWTESRGEGVFGFVLPVSDDSHV